ncbi:UPF0489 family protein [Erwinia billingiae]|uniref:UPF0489 family protein n=1 Tax=Erwinia billingiae TaxID=182337 RepID=UPI002157836A|nr:UPF0489 family protein [Erwinia billingiae]
MKWLIPLVDKGSSGAFIVNFLLQEKNIYFSDNHRTALWCWMQHLNEGENVAVFHIDRHYDTLHLSPSSPYTVAFPGAFNLGSIENYLSLNASIGTTKTPLIRWDNYLSFFISETKLKNNISCIYLATHRDGSYPNNPHNHLFENVEPYNLLEEFDSALEHHEKLIINVDLD